MRRICVLAFLCVVFQQAVNGQYNVKTFGAKADGVTLDTRFIQQAIDKAYSSKGGTVEVPAGTYKIGTLILKDNVELHLQHGATLIGSANYKDYIAVKQQQATRTKDLYAKYFMIFAEGASNIAITGSGIIHGNGLKNFQETRPQNLRPYMIRLVGCNNVTVKGVKILEAANWSFHLLNCKDVNIDGIVIENRGEGNRDGLDIDACQRVTVANSRFSTTDDAIVMKATNDTLCQDIAISNCLFHEIGGSALKTGTESNGGFKNITVSNCVIKDIDHHAGIELMTVDGGMMQNILFENITMDNVATPFFIRLGIRSRPYKPGQYVNHIDDVRDIQLNNISVVNAKLPSSIIGLHNKKISNITITNYTVRSAVAQDAVAYNRVSFQEFDYPAASMFENLPAYALYCRSVENLNLQNVNMYAATGEKRPAITMDRTDHVSLSGVKAETKSKTSPMIHLRNAEDVTIAQSRSFDANDVLVETEENTVKGLRMLNNLLHPSQSEQKAVAALTDASVFEDFETTIKYEIEKGSTVKNMTAHDLSTSLPVTLKMTKKGSLQLCLLVLNESSTPQKLTIKYDGITQDFMVNWKDWGWAPITLLKQYDKDQQVKFEVSAAGAGLKISKVYVRYQDIGFTD
ncbi:MAG TPA: glycoside hydrolase family 28 protein [Chitinophagaceae bacterium]